jgi:cobalt-zinc-cadmium efflux system outer membrane protein
MQMRWWCVGVFLVGVSSSQAQSVLTEAEVLSRISPESARVRVATASVDVAKAEVLATSRWPNPRVVFDREAVAGIRENLSTVYQPLPVTGRRTFEIAAADELVRAAASRADFDVWRMKIEARQAYTALAAAQRRERELTGASDRLRELAGVLARREAAGDAAGFDRLRAEREVQEIEADRSQAVAERRRAQGSLAGFLGADVDPQALVVADPAAVPAPPALETLVARAESTNAELSALQHEVAAARFADHAAARRLVPEPEIHAGTKSSSFAGGDIDTVLGVQATVALFDRGRAERARAAARISQAESRRELLRQTLRTQIAALRAVVDERREAADRYRTGAGVQGAEIERIARVSYEAGERGILELLDAYRLAAASRIRQATLDELARNAAIELAFASGWEMP